MFEEDVKALAYEDGTALFGSLDGTAFIWIDDDVACVEGTAYTGGKLFVIRFGEKPDNIVAGAMTDEEKVWRLRKNASMKMFWPLSEKKTKMILSIRDL